MRCARRSVSDADIGKYQAFAQMLQQWRGVGGEFSFSTQPQVAEPAATAPGADKDDLYN
jgi:hypothetical protein